MSSRLSSAILALAAAFFLLISISTSAWWDGHPVSPTRTYTQIAHVGLHGAKLCLVDGADLETCKDAPTQSVFGPVGYIELVACLLLLVSSVALAVLTLRRRDDRKTFALLALGGAPLADVLAIALIAIGPTSEARIPYGYGLYLFFLGSTSALAAALIARRPIAALVVAPAPQPTAMPMPISQQMPGVDMAALMRDDTMRPAGPEPSFGARSSGGSLPGPAGPLGAPGTGSQPPGSPLFQSAPQLRPLYEAQGTSPVVPPPKFPVRAPTPLPRDKIAAKMGRAPSPAPKPAPFSRPKPPSAPPPIAKAPISRTIPASAPPPIRATPMPPPVTPPPLARATETDPFPNQTDPSGYSTVGDSTDVNVVAHTPPPAVDTTSPDLVNPPVEPAATEEVPLTPRSETQDDNAETIAQQKVSITEIEVAPKKVAISTAPDSLPPPIESKRAASSSGPSPACPQCESPMAWVEEHLRFYCKSCRMYF